MIKEAIELQAVQAISIILAAIVSAVITIVGAMVHKYFKVKIDVEQLTKDEETQVRIQTFIRDAAENAVHYAEDKFSKSPIADSVNSGAQKLDAAVVEFLSQAQKYGVEINTDGAESAVRSAFQRVIGSWSTSIGIVSEKVVESIEKPTKKSIKKLVENPVEKPIEK